MYKNDNFELIEKMYKKIDECLLFDDVPSKRLRVLSEKQMFKMYPFSLFLELKNTKQSPKHHPEGNVWNHTLMVVDKAAELKSRSSTPRVFMWASLLHDIGKSKTTKIRNGRITAYDHDKLGARLAEDFLNELSEAKEFVRKVKMLVNYHMQILYVSKGLPFQDIAGTKRNTDIQELSLLAYCDRLGRIGADIEEEREQVQVFLDKLSSDGFD